MNNRVFIILIGVVVLVIMSCEHDPIYMDSEMDPIDSMENPIDTTMGELDTMINFIPCSEDSVYFKNDIFPLLQGSCAFSGCHDAASQQNGVDLTSYERIIETCDVEAFDLSGSKLYKVLTASDPEKLMPPSPFPKLNSSEIIEIAQWILQGALSNQCDDCDTLDVSYLEDIAPIIQESCSSCHSGVNPSANISLTDYTEVRLQVDNGKLLGAISHKSGFIPMPYNQPQLGQCAIDKIKIWIEAGALDN